MEYLTPSPVLRLRMTITGQDFAPHVASGQRGGNLDNAGGRHFPCVENSAAREILGNYNSTRDSLHD
jgi:hypothetical protein